MFHPYLVLSYFAPETIVPVTSIVVTILGFSMMLGRSSVGLLLSCFRLLARRGRTEGMIAPHARIADRATPRGPDEARRDSKSTVGGRFM
jgi:hypothetical protein